MKKLIIFAVSLFVCFSSAYAVEAAKTDRIPEFLKNFLAEYFRDYGKLPPFIEVPGCDSLPDEEVIPEEKPDTEDDSDINQDNSGSEEDAPALSLEEEIHTLINEERAKHGIAPLELSAKLSTVARAHSADMAAKNYFSHTSLNGLSPFDRLKNAGISYGYAAENIAAGQKTAESVVQAWMNSEGHRRNILNANYKKTGIGVASGGSYGIYHTQVFTD